MGSGIAPGAEHVGTHDYVSQTCTHEYISHTCAHEYISHMCAHEYISHTCIHEYVSHTCTLHGLQYYMALGLEPRQQTDS